MDIFTTLVQTSKMYGISAYAYFRDRISRCFELPSLAACIKNAMKTPAFQPASPIFRGLDPLKSGSSHLFLAAFGDRPVGSENQN
jgi:hypothetical protein